MEDKILNKMLDKLGKGLDYYSVDDVMDERLDKYLEGEYLGDVVWGIFVDGEDNNISGDFEEIYFEDEHDSVENMVWNNFTIIAVNNVLGVLIVVRGSVDVEQISEYDMELSNREEDIIIYTYTDNVEEAVKEYQIEREEYKKQRSKEMAEARRKTEEGLKILKDKIKKERAEEKKYRDTLGSKLIEMGFEQKKGKTGRLLNSYTKRLYIYDDKVYFNLEDVLEEHGKRYSKVENREVMYRIEKDIGLDIGIQVRREGYLEVIKKGTDARLYRYIKGMVKVLNAEYSYYANDESKERVKEDYGYAETLKTYLEYVIDEENKRKKREQEQLRSIFAELSMFM